MSARPRRSCGPAWTTAGAVITGIGQVVSGDLAEPLLDADTIVIADGRIARARLDAAKSILAALGIGERAGAVIATQINLQQSAPNAGVPDGA